MLESYITPVLMSYISKYVKNLKPSDLQVSFWGGDAVLRNLELRLDVLEQELRYPLEIRSGRIRELVLHIPWNAILSKPVEAIIKDVEIVVKLKDVRNSSTTSRNSTHQPSQPDTATANLPREGSTESVEQGQQGYLQGYTSRILNNLTFHIQNLVVKVIEEECDMLMSFNIQLLKYYMADDNWNSSFVYTDCFQGSHSLNKVLEIVDMVVNLGTIESDRIQKDVQQEPFIKKCTVSIRMQSLYGENKVAKSSVCILLDSLVFSADEKQFSLFLHFLDWLLAMYYSKKRLKGRDDVPKLSSSQPTQMSSVEGRRISPSVDEMSAASYEDVLLAGSLGDPERDTAQQEGDGGGWGGWMRSFIWAEEESGKGNAESGEPGKSGTMSIDSSSFSILAKSITISLKVRHHGRVPVFSSVRAPSRTVLNILISGCSLRVHRVPSTQLFAMSVGLMAVHAGACGVCPCAQSLPSSWKTNVDVHEKVPVFSMGDVESCDTELTLAGSLFDSEVPTNQLPPLAEHLLAPRPEYTAVWFTYEYYDIGPKHAIEVCEERLELGEVALLLSPDVVHRLTHFSSTFNESVEACPLFTEGMVVLGDPKAETTFKISLSGGRAVVTSNTHYLAFPSSDQQVKLKPSKLPSHPLPSPPPPLPALSVSLAHLTLSTTSAMYSGNASTDTPQRNQMRVIIKQLELADLENFTNFVLNCPSAQSNTILTLPKFEIYRHLKTTGEDNMEENSSYLQLELEELSGTFSVEQMARSGYMYSSWYTTQSPDVRPKFECPIAPKNLGHLHISVKDSMLTKSISSKFTFLSIAVSSCSIVLLQDSSTGRLCRAVPVVCGPIATDQWNTAGAYCRENLQPQIFSVGSERLVEFCTATPSEDHSGDSYPTMQLSVGGLGVCLDITVLEFLKHIPLHSLKAQEREETSGKQASGAPGLMSSVLPDFPVLPAMNETSPEASSMEAIVISLPHFSLKSAKSHVLDEPVPKSPSSNTTLPWDCTLRHTSIMTIHRGKARYIVEPFTMTVTLADQQGGTGVTLHTDTVALALSHKQGLMVSVCTSNLMESFSALLGSPPTEEAEDSGIHSNYNPPHPRPHPTPSHLSSPAHSTITSATLTTLPAHTSQSTTSSSSQYTYNTFSSLWIQAIVTKVTLTLFAELPPQTHSHKSSRGHTTPSNVGPHTSKTSSTASYATPLTSPMYDTHNESTAFTAGIATETEICSENDLAKFFLEIDGVSVQFDVQEKCTDLILKVSAVDANLYRSNGKPAGSCGADDRVWSPYLSSEKIMSSRGSALPQELSRILAHASPAAVQLQTPSHGPSISSAFRNFVSLELTTPRHVPHKAPKLKLKVQSFETVVWLPVVNVVSSVLSSLRLNSREETQQGEVDTDRSSSEVSSWPAIEANVECCRFVLPSSDYTNSILCNIGSIAMSTSLDYPTMDVRYVISASAFRRLAHLSSDKKQPPLPAYQVDVNSVSVWGVRREEGESDQVLLYAGSSDARIVYTPALYWQPTDIGYMYTTHRPSILACGHCAEINFRTDLNLMLGPEQVDCISTILQTNVLPSTSPPTQPPALPSTDPPPPHTTQQRVPFKGLVSGTTISLTLVSHLHEENAAGLDTSSESSDFVFSTLHGVEATVVPLVQIQFFNLLCSVCTSSSGCKYDCSCFNMAVGYSHDTGVCSYSDLVDAGITSSLLDSLLVETRQGEPLNSREIPPSVVSMTLDTPHSKSPVLSVDISRPVKITLTAQLIGKLLEFGDAILKATKKDNGVDTIIKSELAPDEQSHKISPPSTAQHTDSKVQDSHTSNSTQSRGSIEATNPLAHGTLTSRDSTNTTQVKVNTKQVVVEFQLSSRVLDSSTVGERESFVSLEGEMSLQERSISVAEEGIVLVWDHLTLVFPNVTSTDSKQPTAVTGDIHVNGFQFLGIMECSSIPIILPAQLNCYLLHHLPSSTLDLPYLTLNLSCGLLEVRVSRDVVDLTARVLQAVNNTFSSEERMDAQSGTDTSEEPVGNERGAVHFHDDLRAGDFVYITDSDVIPGYTPQPGEIFFSLGSQDSVTSMSWHYHEPRAVTKLSILPVPFSFTTEEDAPIDIQVGCTLDYWDEDCGIFSVLEEFRLSETTPTEVIVSRLVGSRKWRIAVVEVEWEDDEEGERFVSRADLIDEEGAPVPLASILSPISLAGCTCVDSTFSPEFVPVSDFSLTCHSMQITLIHIPPPDPGWFGQYEVASSSRVPQELMRLNTQHLTCHLKQLRSGDTFVQIDGHPSLYFMDFLDLTWRAVVHPTHLHAQLERKTQKVEAVKDRTSGETSNMFVTVKCSPAVARISQGLLHTAFLTVRTWTLDREKEREKEREGEGEGEKEGEGEREKERGITPVILNHFILCNDTLHDLHFGQVSTDEVVILRSRQCIGYSWRNHKKYPQTLHLCLVTEDVWRWTKPFSIAEEGVQSVEVYVGRHTSLVSVSVTNIGGLQKQVTLTGSWSFYSTLPFPLHLSLASTHHDDHTYTTEDTACELHETLLLSSKSNLASIIIPASQLSGVRIRSSLSSAWSKVFPIYSTSDDWNKPQLLTEMEYSSGQRVNLWYNINSMHSSKVEPIGSRVTFSPLFSVRNHLPFDLTMVTMESSAAGPAPFSLPECVLKGKGEETTLCGLHSDTWYHLTFKESEDGAVSEPAVSLSTFILAHLPFSTMEEEKLQWPYEDASSHVEVTKEKVSSSIKVKLPLDNGSCCNLCAVLERNPTNIITLHIWPDVMVVNRCPISVQVLTKLQENENEEMKEVVSVLSPNDVGIVSLDKFFLLTEWKCKTLVSQPLITDQDTKDSTNAILTEIETSDLCGEFSNLTLVKRVNAMTTVISIKPTYIFHNNTPYDLNVWTCLFDADLCEIRMSDPLVVEYIPSFATKPLLFWENRNTQSSGEPVQALLLKTAGVGSEWSLPLSPDFVRHSFALPVSSQRYAQAVLTMHEHENTVYMVAAEDPAPRLLVQNLTQQNLEVVEEETRGIHRCSQTIPPSCQVAYEPPTFAKQYPLIFDQEIAQTKEKDLQKRIEKTSVKFCLSQGEIVDKQEGSQGEVVDQQEGSQGEIVDKQEGSQGEVVDKQEVSQGEVVDKQEVSQGEVVDKQEGSQGEVVDKQEEKEHVTTSEEWSEPFYLTSDSDRIITIPGGDSILISTHKKGTTLYLTLLPTGQPAPFTSNICSFESSEEEVTGMTMNVDLKLTQLAVCLDDETTDNFRSIEEILQVIADGIVLQYCNSESQGASLGLTFESFNINNMTETEAGDFAVTVIPRGEHLRRASLIESDPTPLLKLSVHYNADSLNLIDEFRIILQPLTLQLEDRLLNRLRLAFQSYGIPGVLGMTSQTGSVRESSSVPEPVLVESRRDVVPLAVTKLVIEPAAFYLNARISFRVLLSCNDSPFRFTRYELENVYSNWTEVSQTVASRYIMSTVAHIGWLLGSLELIGSPGTFIQNVGRGLRDLVTLPYQGLTRSPGWFLLGIGRGTMSFAHHLSSGALRSVTSMASSISHNMERLSLDPHHISYQTQQRQERPATHFTTGLVSGASSFGFSLMSAVAGIVEQPMRSYHQMEGPTSPTVAARSILKGVGKGLLGAVTKPVGGAMELVSQTGQGLMHGTGLARRLCHKQVELQSFTGSLIRTDLPSSSTASAIKLGGDKVLLLSTAVKYITKTGARNPANLLLTPDRIYLLNSASNTLQQNFLISEYTLKECVSGTSNLEEVEIEIVMKSERAETPKFPQVEYFLQLSQKETESSTLVLPQSEQVPPSTTLDLVLCSHKVETGDENQSEEVTGVKVLIETHNATQLLSLYNSLSQLSVHPHTSFCVHRTQKHESFLSAISTSN